MPEGLLELAPVAVIKRGSRGARVYARIDHGQAEPEPPLQFDIATTPVPVEDTTGAGDAFDAGFIAGWLARARRGTRRRRCAPSGDDRRPSCGGAPPAQPALRAAARMSGASAGVRERLQVAPEVAAALAEGRPVVALESTLISHGLAMARQPRGRRARSEAAVRESGAVPATVAINEGRLLVGLDDADARGARHGASAGPC